MRYEYVLPRPASFGTHPTGHLTGIRQGADGHDIAVYDRPLDRDTVRDHELTEQPLFAWRLAVGTHPEQVTPATIATHANAAKHLILCVAPYHWREPGPTIAVDRIQVPAPETKRIIQELPTWSRWAVEWLIDGILHATDLKDLTPHQVARLTARMRREGTATPWSL